MPLKIKPRKILFLGAIFPLRVSLFKVPTCQIALLLTCSSEPAKRLAGNSRQGAGKVSLPPRLQDQSSACWSWQRWRQGESMRSLGEGYGQHGLRTHCSPRNSRRQGRVPKAKRSGPLLGPWGAVTSRFWGETLEDPGPGLGVPGRGGLQLFSLHFLLLPMVSLGAPPSCFLFLICGSFCLLPPCSRALPAWSSAPFVPTRLAGV